MKIEIKKIEFNFNDDDENLADGIHDVISTWLHELDNEKDEKVKYILKQKILELEQVTNRTGKPHIHFKDGKKWDKIIFKK